MQWVIHLVDGAFSLAHHAVFWVSLFTAQKAIADATIDYTDVRQKAGSYNLDCPHPDLIAPSYREPE